MDDWREWRQGGKMAGLFCEGPLFEVQMKMLMFLIFLVAPCLVSADSAKPDVTGATMSPDGYIGGVSLGVDYSLVPIYNYVQNEQSTYYKGSDTNSQSGNSLDVSVRLPLTDSFTILGSMAFSNITGSYVGSGTDQGNTLTDNGSAQYSYYGYSVGVRWYFKPFR